MSNITLVRPSAILQGGDSLEQLIQRTTDILVSAGTKEQDFVNTTSVTVNHNLGRFPAVTVVDSAGTEYEVNVIHLDINNLTVTLNRPMSGRIFCN